VSVKRFIVNDGRNCNVLKCVFNTKKILWH
jgi:hypothetical protein